MAGKPATEPQLRYLADLTAADELAAMLRAAARWLIGFLRAPPPNASRAQQLYMLGMIERLDRDQVRELIGWLREQVEPSESSSQRDPTTSTPASDNQGEAKGSGFTCPQPQAEGRGEPASSAPDPLLDLF